MTRHYQNWINGYLEYSAMSEAPEAFNFWTAISTIAGALGRRVGMSDDFAYFSWFSNMYILFVAPPGIANKTTTMNIGMDLLRKVPDTKFGPDIITWEALVKSMGEAQVNITLPNGDIDTMCAITVASNELGNLLDPKNSQMVDLLVNLWDCRDISKVTKTQGSEKIKNPWVNLIGCTTPSWISGHMPEYVLGGGLMSRFILVYGERKRKIVAYPGRELKRIKSNLRENALKLIHDLTEISTLQGEFRMTDEAAEWGTQWYEKLMGDVIPNNTDERIANYLSRKQAHLHKLAMVVSASCRSDLVIDRDILQYSLGVLEGVEKDMLKVFGHVGMSPETRAIDQVIRCVLQRGKVDQYTLYREFSNRLTNTVFREVVDSAVATGLILRRTNGTSVWLFNPKVVPTVPVAEPIATVQIVPAVKPAA